MTPENSIPIGMHCEKCKTGKVTSWLGWLWRRRQIAVNTLTNEHGRSPIKGDSIAIPEQGVHGPAGELTTSFYRLMHRVSRK